MLLLRYIFLASLLFNSHDETPKDRRIFVAPLKIPVYLSSNFGELRVDHFHSGLDLKTQGATGKEVVAAADGYIYRIGVGPSGFGNALYVVHPNGYSTVYGHLDHFIQPIADFVKEKQYERKSFSVALFPSPGQFPVKQGQVIAYSGNSGSSGGPHLHYEIRKADIEKPVNPMLFDFGITDNLKPVIERLVIYPVYKSSLINNRNETKKIAVTGSKGNYELAQGSPITVCGTTGFGIMAYDLMNDVPNHFGVYSIELKIDSTGIFKYSLDGFPFTESRYVNSHIDYETFMKDEVYVERLYVLPGDHFSDYNRVINRGLFTFNDEKIHKCEIIVSDIYRNRSKLSFTVRSEKSHQSAIKESKKDNITIMPYNRANQFTSEGMNLTIPSGALYDTLEFIYAKDKGTRTMLSDLYFIHNKYTPLQKAANLTIKPDLIPSGLKSKMLIVRLEDDNKKTAMNTIWEGEYLNAEILSFGRYFAGIDTVPPLISLNGLTGITDLTGRKEMKLRIKDDLSGIKSYEPYIDGNWALFEYDQKYETIVYRFDQSKIKKGVEHELILKVTDNKDNVSHFRYKFKW